MTWGFSCLVVTKLWIAGMRLGRLRGEGEIVITTGDELRGGEGGCENDEARRGGEV